MTQPDADSKCYPERAILTRTRILAAGDGTYSAHCHCGEWTETGFQSTDEATRALNIHRGDDDVLELPPKDGKPKALNPMAPARPVRKELSPANEV